MTTLTSCFCGSPLHPDVPSPAPRHLVRVVECPRCDKRWAISYVDGALAAQVWAEPHRTPEEIAHRLTMYSVRGFLSEWESPEVRAAYSAVWAAQVHWSHHTPLGRAVSRLASIPGLRWLDSAPLHLRARVFGWFGMPEHLRTARVHATEADVRRIRRATWGRR